MEIVNLNKQDHNGWDLETYYSEHKARIIFKMTNDVIANLDFKDEFEELLTTKLGLHSEDYMIPDFPHGKFEVYLIDTKPVFQIRLNEEYLPIVDRIAKIEIHDADIPFKELA